MEKTKNYNLNKPDEMDFYDINEFNENSVIIDTELKKINDNKLNTNGNSNNLTSTFTQANTRVNIASEENHITLFGKIMKWFADLGSMAFKSNISKSDLETSLLNEINSKKDKSDGVYILTDKVVDVFWDNINWALFNDLFGQSWRTTPGVYMCRGQTNTSTPSGFAGTYSIKFEVWASNVVSIWLSEDGESGTAGQAHFNIGYFTRSSAVFNKAWFLTPSDITDTSTNSSSYANHSHSLANDAVITSKIKSSAVTDDKIGNRILTDAQADGILIPIAAKNLTSWLQGIRNNIKWLFTNMVTSNTVRGGSFVTGIMNTNGAVNLGFQPSCVIVFGSVNTPVTGIDNWSVLGMAMAIPGNPQYGNTTPNHTGLFAKYTILEITPTGFTTDRMMGAGVNYETLGLPSADQPLKYIAFR